MGNLRQSMTQDEWDEMGIPKNSLLRTINTDGEEDILSKMVDHPQHYGGKDNPYEAIKVIEAWDLDFCLGNVVKYISRAGKKGEWKYREDLEKAAWYLNRAIENIKQ
jgi:hypothetical protein